MIFFPKYRMTGAPFKESERCDCPNKYGNTNPTHRSKNRPRKGSWNIKGNRQITKRLVTKKVNYWYPNTVVLIDILLNDILDTAVSKIMLIDLAQRCIRKK